jgi:hypothetical protein
MEEKLFKAKWIKRMTGRINNQTLNPNLMQDFKCVQCKSKGKLERMLEKCCNLSLGFTTKTRASKCEGMNPHTFKGPFTLGVGVPMDS